MKKILALVLAAMLMLGCISFAAAEEKITLNIWSFTDELGQMIDKYYKPTHPDVEINFLMTPTADFPTRVDALMASAADSDEAPDVFALEAAFVKKYVDSDWSANLLDIGFVAEDFATCIPAMIDIGTNQATGVQKALAWQSTPGALFYRASYAKEYFGVETPEAFQELVADWDTFMETAETLKEKSEGAVKMFCATGDIWNAYSYNRAQGWVVDGKLIIDDVLYDYLDLCKVAEEDDLYAKGTAWSETWFSGMQKDVLTFLLPTWGLHYTLKPHCAEGVNDTMSDEEMKALSEENNGSYGDWRMCAGPVGYSWGGTWVTANAAKVASASDAKKAAIKEFIRFFTLDADHLYQYAMDSGDFVSNNAVVSKIVENGGFPNPFLGGQDHYTAFAQAASLANGKTMTVYDDRINTLWDENCTQPYIKGEKDLDTAIADFKAAVKAQFAELIVE